MAKNISRRAQALESHLSLVGMARDNLGWVLTLLGLSGLSGWAAWAGQAAANAPWHQKLLFGTLGFAVTAFLLAGVWAFTSWIRRTKAQNSAIQRNVAWSGNTYSPGDVIDGGTHSIADIFGKDRYRSTLIFRNAQIEGPGTVLFSNTIVEHSNFYGPRGPVVIDLASADHLATSCHVFWSCHFDRCTFLDAVCIGNFGFRPDEVVMYKIEQIQPAVLAQPNSGAAQEAPK